MEKSVTEITLLDGSICQGREVRVHQSVERWSEFTLEDGSILKTKAAFASVFRIDGKYDPAGNPVYVTKQRFTCVPISTPITLRQQKQRQASSRR